MNIIMNVFMALLVLLVGYLAYKLMGGWVFALVVVLGLLTRFK